jgi:hypothetical protein
MAGRSCRPLPLLGEGRDVALEVAHGDLEASHGTRQLHELRASASATGIANTATVVRAQIRRVLRMVCSFGVAGPNDR